MSDTVTDKRLKWLDQNWEGLVIEGTDLDRGLDLFIKYFKLKEGNFVLVEKTESRAVLKRKEMVDLSSTPNLWSKTETLCIRVFQELDWKKRLVGSATK
jgi:hypothetical protein